MQLCRPVGKGKLLVPSQNAFPQVSAEIARLDAARRQADEASLKTLAGAYETALASARKRIASVVATFASAPAMQSVSLLLKSESVLVDNVMGQTSWS